MWSGRAWWIGGRGGEEAPVTQALSPAVSVLEKNGRMRTQCRARTPTHQHVSTGGCLGAHDQPHDMQAWPGGLAGASPLHQKAVGLIPYQGV